jgi:hypothetical protein
MSVDDALDDAFSDPETFNPFNGCPWRVYLNALSEWYMTQEDGEFVPLSDHHVRWAERFADGDDFTLLAHRFALKTFVVLAYIAARLEYTDGFTALWLTNTQTQAKDKADREFNKLTRRAPFLTNTAEANRTEDTIQTKTFENGAAFHSGWLEGGIEGARADLIVFDDIIKEKGDGKTSDIWEWCAGAAMPIGKRDSQEVFIGTRKRPNDLYAYIGDKTEYPIVEWPLIRERWQDNDSDTVGDLAPKRYYTPIDNPLPGERDTVHVLWPEARGASFIRDKYPKVGAKMFDRAYCLVTGNFEGLVYKWFGESNLIDDADLPDTFDKTIYGLDFGGSVPTALVCCRRAGDEWYIVDEFYETRVTDDAIAAEGNRMYDTYGRGNIYADHEPRTIEKLNKEGLLAKEADKAVDEGIRHVNGLRENLYVSRSCQNLINEFNSYQYKDGGDSDDVLKENDHLMDALRYALFTDDTALDAGGVTGVF